MGHQDPNLVGIRRLCTMIGIDLCNKTNIPMPKWPYRCDTAITYALWRDDFS